MKLNPEASKINEINKFFRSAPVFFPLDHMPNRVSDFAEPKAKNENHSTTETGVSSVNFAEYRNLRSKRTRSVLKFT